jgi:WD40 repeat protein/serine/threonine protein kinase
LEHWHTGSNLGVGRLGLDDFLLGAAAPQIENVELGGMMTQAIARNRYEVLLQDVGSAERFVRQSLALLESDFRHLALLALGDWARLGIVSHDLFQAVASLQRPSWGMWNGLITALSKARKSTLRTAGDAERDRIEQAGALQTVLMQFELRLDREVAESLKPLCELTRSVLPKKLRAKSVLTLPITLRNRVAHDAPTAIGWWEDAARAIRALVEYHAHMSPLALLIDDQQEFSSPWFFVGDDGTPWSFNGLANDMAVIYVSPDGESRFEPDRTQDAMLAFQLLLGKSEAQETDFRSLLSKLAPEDIKGVLMGDYLVGRPIGSGGFATVHVGRQLSTGRKMAIKILHDGQSDRIQERFHQEARFLSRLEHSNIVSVYGYGEETWSAPRAFSLSDEEWFQTFSKSAPVKSYIAMEWVDGGTLDKEFEKAGGDRNSNVQLAEWFSQAAASLSAVHNAGLVHRDIKPSNLMINEEGTIKLMDFGIARAQDKDRTLQTTTGNAFGTPAYMSPEQIRSVDREAEVGPPTDVYSLCATFYELFTRRRVYDHDTVGLEMVTTKKLSGERPERPSGSAKHLPWELETIVMGGLEADVADRYLTMDELKRDIDHFLADEPIQYQKPTLSRRLRLGYRRNRTLSNVVVGFLLIVFSGSAYYLNSLDGKNQELVGKNQQLTRKTAEAVSARAEAETEKTEAIRQKGIAQEERDEANWQRDTAEHEVYLNHVASAGREWDARNGAAAWPHLRACSTDLRGWEYRHLYARFTRHLKTFKGHKEEVTDVAYSPNGDLVASASHDGMIKLWDTKTGRHKNTLAGHLHVVSSIAFSPNGKKIVSGSWDTKVKIWDTDAPAGQGALTIQAHTTPVSAVAFSPDGKLVATSGTLLADLKLWNAETGAMVKDLKGHNFQISSIAFAPDGNRMTSAGWDGSLFVWDVHTGAQLMTLAGHEGRVSGVAYSPDGSVIVSSGNAGLVISWDPDTGKAIRTIKTGETFLNDVLFMSDGKRVMTCGQAGALRVWELATGKEKLLLQGHSGSVTSISLSPDGNRLVSGSWDNTIKLWDSNIQPHTKTLFGHEGRVSAVAYSSDGKSVLSGSWDGTARLWDIEQKKEIRKWDEVGGHAVALSPDGKRAVFGAVPVRVCDTETGEELLKLDGHNGRVFTIAYSPTGDRIVTGGRDDLLIVWDAITGERLHTLAGHTRYVLCSTFTPDGLRVLSGAGDGTMKLWDVTNGELIHTYEGHTGNVAGVAVSPDGSMFVSASHDNTLKVWDANTGDELRTLEGHNNMVSSVAFLPDSSRIVSGGWDNTVKLWDSKSGKGTLTLQGHQNCVLSICVSPDGNLIVSGGQDDAIKVWDSRTGKEHVDAADVAEKSNDFFAAAFHLRRLIEPSDSKSKKQRALAERLAYAESILPDQEPLIAVVRKFHKKELEKLAALPPPVEQLISTELLYSTHAIVLLNPEIQPVLQLTMEQRKQLASLFDKLLDEGLNVLTPEQRAIWDAELVKAEQDQE